MKRIRLLFTEGPGPSSQFVEAEDESGNGINIGTWHKRGKYHLLEINSELLDQHAYAEDDPRAFRREVYELIENARRKQDKQHGGPEHDAEHTWNDWTAFIVKQLGKVQKAKNGGASVQKIVTEVAALAVAWIESIEFN